MYRLGFQTHFEHLRVCQLFCYRRYVAYHGTVSQTDNMLFENERPVVLRTVLGFGNVPVNKPEALVGGLGCREWGFGVGCQS